jgi:hypothetical protein
MIGAILDLLRPTPREVVNLARREADPRYVADFEPLHLGPVLSLLVLAGIGIAGAIAAPFRLIATLYSRRK